MVLIDLQNHTATFCPPLQGAKVANLSPLIRLTLQAYLDAPTPSSITPVYAYPDPLIVSLHPLTDLRFGPSPHPVVVTPVTPPVFFLYVSLSPLSFSLICF